MYKVLLSGASHAFVPEVVPLSSAPEGSSYRGIALRGSSHPGPGSVAPGNGLAKEKCGWGELTPNIDCKL